jgi:trypsin
MSRKLWALVAACAIVLAGALLGVPGVPSALAVSSTRTSLPRDVRSSRSSRPLRPRAQTRVHEVLPRLVWSGSRPKIIGGYGAVQSDWGFMAFVAYFDSSGNVEFVCSGTVIAPNVVLTAGHCAVDEGTDVPLDPSGYVVVTDSVDWTNTAQRQLSPVSRVIVNPGYDPASDTYDAALLVLSTPTTAPTIPLASSADESLYDGGTGAVIAGWGETYDGGAPVEYLQWAPTVVQNPGYCSQFNPYFDSYAQLCAVNPPDFSTGTCNGDSGGPIAAYDTADQLVEIGLTTEGPVDCNTDTADYFAATLPLSTWAASWIQAVAPPSPPSPPPAPAPAPSTPSPSPSPTPPAQPPSAPTLPTLGGSTAKHYVRLTLAGGLGRAFKHGSQYTARCTRESSTRFKCAVTFSSPPNDYYGSVTVYYVSGASGSLEWTDTYTIHSVNDQCYFHSGHPQRCRVDTRHGT